MRFCLVICVFVGAAALVGGARTEDGGPPAPLATCDYSIWLDGNRDWSDGRNGTDPTHGGDGQDILFGGLEGDALTGEGGNDFLYAGCPGGCDQTGPVTYFNRLDGGDGDDVLAARNNRGDDVLFGGTGFDTCYVDRGDETHSCEDKRVG